MESQSSKTGQSWVRIRVWALWHSTRDSQTSVCDRITRGLSLRFTNKGNEGSLEKRTIPGPGQRKYEVCPEHSVALENKKMLKNEWGPGERTQEPMWRGSQWPNLGQLEQPNK